MLAVLVFIQQQTVAILLCTRRWQGRAAHVASTCLHGRSPGSLEGDFKALPGATVSCSTDIKLVKMHCMCSAVYLKD